MIWPVSSGPSAPRLPRIETPDKARALGASEAFDMGSCPLVAASDQRTDKSVAIPARIKSSITTPEVFQSTSFNQVEISAEVTANQG